MNLNQNPTRDQLADLFRPCHDREWHVVWADRAGEVHITRTAPDPEPTIEGFAAAHPDAQLVLRPMAPDCQFVGPAGADDWMWVEDVFGAMMDQWPAARGHAVAVGVEDW